MSGDWSELSLDEKLTELGFEREKDEAAGDPAVDQRRMHAALDQLLDTGGLVVEIEAMVKPFAEGVIGAQPDVICRDIYNLIQAEEEEEDDEG